MVTLGTPHKTPEGFAELTQRSRGLTQRHRTLLLLIDGQRRLDQVLHLAQQAGVPRAYIDELVALGLVVVPMAPGSVATTSAMAPPVPGSVTGPVPPILPQNLPQNLSPTTIPPPRREPVPPTPAPATGPIDIELGSNFTVNGPGEGPVEPDLAPDTWHDSDAFGRALSSSELAALDSSDASLAAAREMLLQALRQEAPVAGAVTMLRVRRARNRDALVALLPEVEQKIGHQRHLSDAAHIIRRAQELLTEG